MKKISVGSNGEVALVDDEDFEWLSRYNWFVTKRGYATRSIFGKKNKKIYMHREILGCSDSEDVDHANGNKLDNTRQNIRVCNYSQNNHNRIFQKRGKNLSKYRGVQPNNKGIGGKWNSKISVNNKQIYLGTFSSEEDAGLAYNQAAIKYFGEFAYLNTIDYG